MKAVLVLCLLVVLLPFVLGQTCGGNQPLKFGKTKTGFCAWVWAERLASPRGVAIAKNGDVLVVEQDRAQVTVLFDTNEDGRSEVPERAVLAKAPGLNHAVIIHKDFLYASSSSTVYRWKYTTGQRSSLGNPTVVVRSIPKDGHSTRTILFDQDGLLYVQLGSASNVDPNSNHARIHRWNITSIPADGFAWESGQIFADGLRNEVGLRMDKEGRIWGVENGIDNVYRQSLGGDIHNTNPSEELNLFLPSTPGLFYGYPYCWSTFNLSMAAPGTQWATNQFLNDGIHTDAWCQNRANVVVPKLNLPAHYAPLDLHFYYKGANSTFPAEYDGHAFVSCHGSWNRQPPAGYKVLHVPFASGEPTGYEPFLEYEGPGDIGPNWAHRPVGLGMIDKCGPLGTCLLVSSDSSGVIIAVARQR